MRQLAKMKATNVQTQVKSGTVDWTEISSKTKTFSCMHRCTHVHVQGQRSAALKPAQLLQTYAHTHTSPLH